MGSRATSEESVGRELACARAATRRRCGLGPRTMSSRSISLHGCARRPRSVPLVDDSAELSRWIEGAIDVERAGFELSSEFFYKKPSRWSSQISFGLFKPFALSPVLFSP